MAPATTLDCWKTMLRGSEMLKLSSSKKAGKRKIQKKLFYLEDDLTAINYKSHGKLGKLRRIESASIVQVICDNSLEETVKSYGEGLPSNSAMSLKIKGSEDVIIVAPSSELAQIWRVGLLRLMEIGQKDPTKHAGRDRWLRNEFNKLAKTFGRPEVPFREILGFLPTTGIGITAQPIYLKKMKEFQTSTRRSAMETLNVDEFVAFFNAICTRKHEVSLLKGLATNGEVLTPNDVEYFLTHIQCVPNVTHDACVRLIEQFELTEQGRERKELSVEGLTRYLLSKEGDVFDKAHDSVYQDMTQPLNHYFIASSHNTYLMRDQLSGESSAQPYIEALRKGYRCVEIDCHDGKDGEPVVYHKHTLTSEVSLRDVLSAIKANAFITSPYPVIITMENHCSVETQKRMARYIEIILGDMVYKEGLHHSLAALPAPEFFKNTILIRSKKRKLDDEKSEYERSDVSSDERDDSPEGKQSWSPEEADETRKLPDNVNGSNSLKPPAKSKSRKKTIAHEFSQLITMANAKFKDFELSKALMKFYHSSSFSETKLEKLMQENVADLVEFNKSCMSRIYPSGKRVSSSNYNPQKAWNVGCQLVALNQQRHGEPVDLYLGRFRQNGRAGYNLKPRFLRDRECKFDPSTACETAGIESKVLRVTIISGHQFPPDVVGGVGFKDELDPYVVTDIHGVPADSFSHRTSTVMNNPLNPIWGETFKKKLLIPELAMVRFSVYDEDPAFDDFIGQFSLPLASLRPGFRHVHLLNKDRVQLDGASLFIYTELLDSQDSEEDVEQAGACRFM